MRAVLLAWLQHSMTQQQSAEQRMHWAHRWSCKKALNKAYSAWKLQWCRKEQCAQLHRQQQLDNFLTCVLQVSHGRSVTFQTPTAVDMPC
jgi:hypothetical protein